MCSSLPLTFNLTTPHLHKHLSDPNTNNSLTLLSKPFTQSFVCFTFPPSSSSSSSSNNANNSSYDREESRWLREEQRWLREEQRWLKEEQRWAAERDTLLGEIQTLELRIQELQRQNSLQQAAVTEAVGNIAKLLKVLKEGELGKNVNRIAESGSSAIPLVMDTSIEAKEAKEEENEEEEEVIVKEIINVMDTQVKEEKKRKKLRKGLEGDDVRAMQEALQKLGFYSGEEDMEFSAFSDGTERAVKTWQATIDLPEDGIMTAELLERLFMELNIEGSSLTAEKVPENNAGTVPKKKPANGAPAKFLTEIEHTIVKKEGSTGKKAEVPRDRVFLLGENRWEDSSRLSGNKNNTVSKGGSSSSSRISSPTKCIPCRGEGRLLCMECDGTGEPNIEPQFMEWVGEDTKCPYCEGHGFITCDACQGK